MKWVNSYLDTYGRDLAMALVLGIGGKAARSDLETLAQPLKKLIFRGGGARAWLEEALLSEDFPSARVPVQERTVFLNKIIRYERSRDPRSSFVLSLLSLWCQSSDADADFPVQLTRRREDDCRRQAVLGHLSGYFLVRGQSRCFGLTWQGVWRVHEYMILEASGGPAVLENKDVLSSKPRDYDQL